MGDRLCQAVRVMSFDRYVYPGTNVLVNKFGIMDAAALEPVERSMSSRAIACMESEGVTGRFDRQHIQDIHWRIFGEVYDWAGEFRDIQIWKGGTEFAAPDEIPDNLDSLCAGIQKAGYFQGVDRIGTANAIADIMADLNLIHPFREGNGRTQRAFISQLALNAGYDLDFTKMSENDMRNASMAANRNNRNLMRYLFRDAMSEKLYGLGPVRAAAPETPALLETPKKPREQGAMARMKALFAGRNPARSKQSSKSGPEF